jgi:predicted transcriptional regulator
MRSISEKSARLTVQPLNAPPSSDAAASSATRSRKIGDIVDYQIAGGSRRVVSTIATNPPTLRERVIRELRNEGYRLKEIAELLGITIQRVSQIERQMMVRRDGVNRRDGAGKLTPRRIKTTENFAKRLDSINSSYEACFDSILRRTYKRQHHLDKRAKRFESSLFLKLWPLIELYRGNPFSFSKLLEDFPQIAKEHHLRQLLCRLRRIGLLKTIGLMRVTGHNLPEVVMVEAPLEQQAADSIERLVVRWTKKLQQLQWEYRFARPARSLDSVRMRLIESFTEQGLSADEIVGIFGKGVPYSSRAIAEQATRSADQHIFAT